MLELKVGKKTNGRKIVGNDKHSKGAFQSAITYAEEVQLKYPEYKISTAGHSLGGAEAIYVAVLLGVNAVTFTRFFPTSES